MSKQPNTSIAFETPADLAQWLAAHHGIAKELWVRIYKKGTGRPSVTWADCVVEAIAFGWIDSRRRSLDEDSYLQRLTPRKPGSQWSQKNCEHAQRLISEGRMTPAGLRHIDAAKADGRWTNAYAGSAAMEIPADFLEALERNPLAKDFFATLDRKNLYAIYYRLTTAKRPETRDKRMNAILEQLARAQRFH